MAWTCADHPEKWSRAAAGSSPKEAPSECRKYPYQYVSRSLIRTAPNSVPGPHTWKRRPSDVVVSGMTVRQLVLPL
jgi:hypothetical protein